MTREEAFEFLDRTARGIAEMFGSSCETLVHDMGDPRHPILSIYNGHVSGRTVGSTLDILGTAKELDHDALVTDFVNLQILYIDGFIMRPAGGFVNSSGGKNGPSPGEKTAPASWRRRLCAGAAEVTGSPDRPRWPRP